MIMSTQLHVVRVRTPDLAVVVVQGVRTRFSNIIERVMAHRQARAEYEVRAVLSSFSAEQLAGYGWSLQEVHRLKG